MINYPYEDEPTDFADMASEILRKIFQWGMIVAVIVLICLGKV